MSNYTKEDIEIIRRAYDPTDCRTWPYYPIVMPLRDGTGPVDDSECDKITWEVWDRFYLST